MDYCNSLFIGLPNVILKKVRSVLNRAARLIFNLSLRVPTTSSLTELHWLPLKARIEFKIRLITFKALKFSQPSYIRKLLSFSSHESTLGLRSAMTLTVYINLELLEREDMLVFVNFWCFCLLFSFSLRFFSSTCEFRFIERIGAHCKQSPDFMIIIILTLSCIYIINCQLQLNTPAP